MNVYWNKKGHITFQSALQHPKKGRTQLNRRNVTMEQLEQLFANPRQHTGRGYY